MFQTYRDFEKEVQWLAKNKDKVSAATQPVPAA